MRKLRNDNKLLNKKEEKEKESVKPKENPQLHGKYTKQMQTGQKYTKSVITEKYHQSTPQSRNFKTNESYEYHSEYRPYHQVNQNSSSEKHFYSSNQYYTSNKNMNADYNMNDDRYYSTDYKKMIFGNTDLRNEYSPIADARVNIRKKLLEEKNFSQAYMSNSDDELVENFQFKERKNIRNNSEQKYDSIVRIIGYSNVIPIYNQRMIALMDMNQNVKEYNKKIEHNYVQKSNIQQVQKKEFKKPAQIETVKKQEIIKKYEVKKKPEIKKEENKYKQYERKKEESVKKEVKKTEVVQKKEVKIENKKEIKKEVKEPKIIKRKENIKATFSTNHHGRYKCTGDISNDIMNARKNYKQNSEEKNRKIVVIVEKSSKSAKKTENKTKVNNTAVKTNTVIKKEAPKTEIKKTEIKREEKTKIVSNVKPKVNTTTTKKIEINKNVTNYKRVKEESKTVQNSPKKMMAKRNIQVKTESYGNIEDIHRRENLDLAKIINIREVNRLYEMRRNKRTSTPKMKTKRINLGDNYKYYERKYMQSPDENYYTIHQRRNQRIIYGEQILESSGKIKMKMYKTKPLIREERYNKQLIDNAKIPSFNDNYMAYNKIYQNNYGNIRNKSEQYYYEQSSSYN